MNLPSCPDSELGLLGNVIDHQGEGWSLVERDLFTNERAIILADAIEGLLTDKQPIMIETVARRCKDYGLVSESTSKAAGGAEYHANILREKRALRALQADASRTIRTVAVLDRETRSINSDVTGCIVESTNAQRAALSALVGSEKRSPKDYLRQVVDRMEAADRGELPPCIPTGIPRLDSMLDGGFQRNFMVSIGARSGVGKTALAVWLTASACNAGKSVLYGSRELQGAVIAHRLLCLESKTHFRLSDGIKRVSEEKRSALLAAQNRIKDWPLDIRDDITTLEELIGTATRSNPDLLVVDHVGIFGVRQSNGSSLYEDMTRKSNLLRDFAKDTGIPTVVLCQLNRAATESDRPGLHHIKQSGALEEDSRVVMLLSIDESEVRPSIDRLLIDVAKNTTGQCGLIQTEFQKAICQFTQVKIPHEP
jgi:replicative DNA helicase